MGFWKRKPKKTPDQLRREKAQKKLQDAEFNFGMKAGKTDSAYGRREKEQSQKEFYEAMDLWEQAANELKKLK